MTSWRTAAAPFSWAAARTLTALRLGEDRAASAGVDVARLRFLSLLRASVLSAAAVAFVGVVGFIGLVGPHIARLLVGEDHRFFLPGAMLSGALIMALVGSVRMFTLSHRLRKLERERERIKHALQG